VAEVSIPGSDVIGATALTPRICHVRGPTGGSGHPETRERVPNFAFAILRVFWELGVQIHPWQSTVWSIEGSWAESNQLVHQHQKLLQLIGCGYMLILSYFDPFNIISVGKLCLV
jgi:hypothetical protein